MDNLTPAKFTLCWDCAKACGGCSWTEYYSQTPVDGWVADKRILRMDNYKFCYTYVVRQCPEFVRDAAGGGIYRYRDGKVIRDVLHWIEKLS